jgi:quinol-cytochrome oxidoreductase complex cytochrome b subunit
MSTMWTTKLRKATVEKFEPQDILPDDQPSYVASWIYVFGVLTLASLLVIIVSGFVLTTKGISWWHTSSVGHFVNSWHLWSVELFFVFMVVHLWGKFWMAAWRGRRFATWVTGSLAFFASVGTGFTGYLIQMGSTPQGLDLSSTLLTQVKPFFFTSRYCLWWLD